jgi:hypothetical protein
MKLRKNLIYILSSRVVVVVGMGVVAAVGDLAVVVVVPQELNQH